jgi:hypothetical protein
MHRGEGDKRKFKPTIVTNPYNRHKLNDGFRPWQPRDKTYHLFEPFAEDGTVADIVPRWNKGPEEE